jgi:hypothetical protein
MPSNVKEGWGNKSTTDAEVTGDVNATIEGVALISFSLNGTATSVPATTKTTILSATYSASFNNIALISCSGQDYAKFYLTLNTVDIDIRRSGPSSNVEYDFKSNPLGLTTGDTIDVKVEHFNTGNLLDFEATIYGYA